MNYLGIYCDGYLLTTEFDWIRSEYKVRALKNLCYRKRAVATYSRKTSKN
jgi:hypothetical protein